MRRSFAPLLAALPALFALACEALPPEVQPRMPPAPPPPPVVAPPAPTVTPDAEFRSGPPQPGPEVPFVAPKIEEARLSNGLRVLLVEQHDLPIVSVQVVSSQGAAQAAPGVGAFAGAMLLGGTKKRSAEQLSDQFQALGAEFGAFADFDSTVVHAQVLGNRLGEALELLADIVQNPAFARDELKRERAKRLTTLQQEKDSPQRQLAVAVGTVLYPAKHPYRSTLLGDESAITKISSADLETFHRANVEPDRVTIVVAGDVQRSRLLEQLEASFGSWRGKASKAKAPVDPGPPVADAPRVVIVDRPGASQTNVAVAAVGVPRTVKDYDALLLMNAMLGGQFSSRLNMNLREKHGYTYGAWSSFSMRQGPGPFSAGAAVVREHTAAAIREIFAELEAMRAKPVTDDELETARNYLIKQLPARFETTESTAGTLAGLATFGLPLDEFATRPARFARITREDIQRVAAAYLKPEQMRVVLIGDAATIKASIDELALGKVEVRATASGAAPAAAKADKSADKSAEKAANKAADKAADKSADKAADKSADKGDKKVDKGSKVDKPVIKGSKKK